jgi:hypothetical protein
MQIVWQMHQSDISVQRRLLSQIQLKKMGIYYFLSFLELSLRCTLLCFDVYAELESVYLLPTADFWSMILPGLRGMACWPHSQLDGRAAMCTH